MVKNLPGYDPWVGRIPRRRARQPTPVFLPGESPWTRRLAGYSPWGCKESDTTEIPSTQSKIILTAFSFRYHAVIQGHCYA